MTFRLLLSLVLLQFGEKGVGSASATDVRKVDLQSAIESRLGAGHKTATHKELRNVGPSITGMMRVLGRDRVLARFDRLLAT